MNAFLLALLLTVSTPLAFLVGACYAGLAFYAVMLMLWGEDDYGHWKYNVYGLLLGLLLFFAPMYCIIKFN